MAIKLEFKDPNRLIAMLDGSREVKCKQVHEDSFLYGFITKLRSEVRRLWPACPTYADRPVNVELCKKKLPECEITKKALELHGRVLNLHDFRNWGWCGNSFVFFINHDPKIYCIVLSFRTSCSPDVEPLQNCVRKLLSSSFA